MRHESKFAVSCVWGAGGLRLSGDKVSGWLHSVCAFREAGLDWCPACGGQDIVRKAAVPGTATVPIGLKPVFLVTEVPKCECAAAAKRFEATPFAPAYVDTPRLQTFVEGLSGRMTISDLAAITGLGWDTVKDIVKARWKRIMAILD